MLIAALDKHILPAAARWASDKLRDDSQESLARRCGDKLEGRADAAPFCNFERGMDRGQIPKVVAISHGNGDPKRDKVYAVYLDEEGGQREFLTIDNLRPSNERTNPDGDSHRAKLADFLARCDPDLVVVGGFQANTHRLFNDISVIAREKSDERIHDLVDIVDEVERKKRASFRIQFVTDDAGTHLSAL